MKFSILLLTALIIYDLETQLIFKGSKKYEPETKTQSISVLDNRDNIQIVSIKTLEKKWHQSGGMEGIDGWTSEKYRYLPEPPKTFIGDISVSFQDQGKTHFQFNRGIKRVYADGTRFDDILKNKETNQVFEHRVREKKDGKWTSRVLYSDEKARPKGYTGLTVTCASCHNEAGTGKYNGGLVPGGDTVLSDPLNWQLISR